MSDTTANCRLSRVSRISCMSRMACSSCESRVNLRAYRHVCRGVLLCALFAWGLMAGGDLAAAAGDDAFAILSQPTLPRLRVNGVRWAHFSSTTGNAICRLSVEKVIPASKRSGPFVFPAPGYELRQVAIDIIPGNCTAQDWDGLASVLAELRRFTLREAITLRLPDEPGNGAGVSWRVEGAPSLRASPAEQGAGRLLFLSRDAAGRRVPLLLYRDISSGALVLQAPLQPPGFSRGGE